MFRRCICDISINKNPNPMLAKKTKYRNEPFKFIFPFSCGRDFVLYNGYIIQITVKKNIVTVRLNKINIAFTLKPISHSFQNFTLAASVKFNKWKKNGSSSVGDDISIGKLLTISVLCFEGRVSCAKTESVALPGVNTFSNSNTAARLSIILLSASVNGFLLIRIVPVPLLSA